MIKSLVVILGCVSLSGCFYQNTNKIDIQKAIKFCGSVGGIYEIKAWWDGKERIKCTDFTSTKTEEVTL
jgi:hypothetical protein